MQLGNLIEAELVSHDPTGVDLRQLYQLHVDFADIRKVLFDDLNGELRHFLNALEDVEAAPTAVALHRIGGIRHQLQLMQHKLGDHEGSIDESGFNDVGDTAVDNHAGIQYFEGMLGTGLPAK